MQPLSRTDGTKARNGDPFAALRRFVAADRPKTAPRRHVSAACELCSVPIAPLHRHLLEMETRDVACACDPCALRFENVVAGRFKLIPRDARALAGFRMTEAQWSSIGVPIGLAFMVFNSETDRRTALYPSPAGITESLLSMRAWEGIAAANPELHDMRHDVEALLVNRLDEDAPLYVIAPIDACYELAGIIRVHWRGFSGGEEVWKEVDTFFRRLKKRTRDA